METIAVLFIFFVLLMFSIIFYIGYSRGRAELSLSEYHQAKSIQIAEKIHDMAELRDTRQGIATINCFDVFKVEAFSLLMEEDESLKQGIYQERFGDSLIIIHQVYPDEKEWVLYNNSKPSFRYSYPYFIPKCIFDPLKQEQGYSLGLLEVVYYSN